MEIKPLKIVGAFKIKPNKFEDERGIFVRTFCYNLATKNENFVFQYGGLIMVFSPRDRVYMALNHEEPDRVPLALGGGPYGLVDEVYLKLVDYFGLEKPVPPFRKGHSISYMDDRLLEKLGTDIR